MKRRATWSQKSWALVTVRREGKRVFTAAEVSLDVRRDGRPPAEMLEHTLVCCFK